MDPREELEDPTSTTVEVVAGGPELTQYVCE